jgi:hypothetical protein
LECEEEEEEEEEKMFVLSRRRRTVLLTCGAVAAGGYVSYRLYRSAVFARKRYQVYLLCKSLWSILEVLALGSDSASVVFKDLHSFLLSDKDEVPRSLKQLLKIGACPELQRCVSAISGSVSHGILQSLSASAARGPPTSILRNKDGFARKEHRAWVTKEKVLSWKDEVDDEGPEEIDGVSWREYDVGSPNQAEEGTWDQVSWKSAGSLLDGVGAQVGTSMAKGMKEELVGASIAEGEMNAVSEEVGNQLADRLLNKLFSEAGKGFASAVVASASRSLVVSVIEQLNLLRYSTTQNSIREEKSDALTWLMEFASSTKARPVIIDCIQTFVATAVSVYLDRTKDVNVFDDMVTGIVKPEHQGPVTELLSTVCSSSVETLVRTSHEVLASGGKSTLPSNENLLNPPQYLRSSLTRPAKQEEAILSSYRGIFPPTLNEDSASSSTTGRGPDNTTVTHHQSPHLNQDMETLVVVPNSFLNNASGKKDEAAFMSVIDGLSRVLAVPSNRKLIMEVAGTMTSEGVRSFIEVLMGRFTAVFRGKTKEEEPMNQDGRELVKRSVIGDKLQQVGDLTKAAVDKSVVAMTMCFVICLHSVVGGVRLLQPFSS